MKLYRNGSEIGSKNQTGSISTYSTPLVMGCFENLTKSSTYCFKGDFDEFAVYSAALSSTQVSDHYQEALATSTLPVNTFLPTITGTKSEGWTLVAAPGTWSNDPTDYSYQWRRCHAVTGDCADVPGETGHLYVLGRDDVGRKLKVRVRAANVSGSDTADSAASDVVEPWAEMPGSYRDDVLATSPDHYWGLGETNGTTGAAEDHAGSSDGTFKDSTMTPTLERGVGGPALGGRADEAMRIGGSTSVPNASGYVEVPANSWGMAGQQSFSVSLWVRWEGLRYQGASPVHQGMVGNLNFNTSFGGWGVYVTSAGKVAFHRNTSGSSALESSESLGTSRWRMVTVTYNGATEKIFIDGEVVASRSNSDSLSGGQATLEIGRQDFNKWLSGYLGSLRGTVDEVALWRRALTDSEVTAHYVPPLDLAGAQAYGASQGCADFACNRTLLRSDPVNTATGNYVAQTIDAKLSGVGIPFRPERTYNSLDPVAGSFGPGWTHSLEMSLGISSSGDVIARAPDGQQLAFSRQPDGSFRAAAGGRSSLASVGGEYELVLHNGETLTFDTEGRVLSYVDRNGKGLAFAYDGNGRLATVTDAAGRVVVFTHDSGSGLLTEVELPDERTVAYGYTDGRLTAATDLRGGTTEYTYTEEGWLETIVDQNEHTVVENTYDETGRVIAQLDALGEETIFSWDPETQTAVTTDARGQEWTDVYANNVLLESIDPLGNVAIYDYD
jgi:YD repeat-containing protein